MINDNETLKLDCTNGKGKRYCAQILQNKAIAYEVRRTDVSVMKYLCAAGDRVTSKRNLTEINSGMITLREDGD